ncbi:Uncharacterized protein dnm_017470 [Desulfonema magnum]|uniref:Uncharacterized protein n=1 Tax=Desulfonema magnum TaxID=45655 RepID=A0A975BI42_9BACT|nr:Uncharacterized protein dnm_017470 [Desulfonema magnum]
MFPGCCGTAEKPGFFPRMRWLFPPEKPGVLCPPSFESVSGFRLNGHSEILYNKDSHLFFHNQLCKMFKRSVVGPLRVIRKATTGKLPAFQMITYTLTANSLT